MTKQDEIRPLTRQVYEALVYDVWPSSAAIVDFGLKTARHLGALQYAVKYDGVTLEQLDAACGKGRALQALISGKNPYRDVTFETVWDTLPREPRQAPPRQGPAREERSQRQSEGPRPGVKPQHRQKKGQGQGL